MMNADAIKKDDTCPQCNEAFELDVKRMLELSDSKKLPFTCSKCFYFTLCGACLDKVDWSSFECPVCHKKQGFDRDDPVPNVRLCHVLKKQQETTSQGGEEAAVASVAGFSADASSRSGLEDANSTGIPHQETPKASSGNDNLKDSSPPASVCQRSTTTTEVNQEAAAAMGGGDIIRSEGSGGTVGTAKAPSTGNSKTDSPLESGEEKAKSSSDVDKTLEESSPSSPTRRSPRASAEAKQEDSQPSTKSEETKKNEPNVGRPNKRKDVPASLYAFHKKGDRVYCRWPATNRFYWGHIARVNRREKGKATYKVNFDDGDILDDVDELEFLTEEEMKNKGNARKKTKPNPPSPPTLAKTDSDKSTPAASNQDKKPPSVTPVPSELLPTISQSSSDDDGNGADASSAQGFVGLPNAADRATIGNSAKNEFMTAPFFHVNSFVNAKNRTNKGFGPFIREQALTSGFNKVGNEVHDLVKAGASHEVVRKAILNGPKGVAGPEATQVSMWLREVKVGSYILMRHEYAECPWLPNRLKDDQGNYIGKVYVIGRVTQVVEPNSAEEKAIAANLPEIDDEWCHSFCRVQFDKMILKENLDKKTLDYINKICQKTVTRICVAGDSWKKIGTDAATIRNDIWENATISISSQDFVESTFSSLADTPMDSHVQLDD